ncbi:hypothetical protein SEA_JACKO_19 [Microbacterium phage Jacko]|nr:hypothetical protein SEA_JACKO_19 [Microbacterium phage Jacko]
MKSWIDENNRVYVAVKPGEDATCGEVIDLMNKAIDDADMEGRVGISDVFNLSDTFFVTDETLEKEVWEDSDMLSFNLDLERTHNLIVVIDIEEATGA